MNKSEEIFLKLDEFVETHTKDGYEKSIYSSISRNFPRSESVKTVFPKGSERKNSLRMTLSRLFEINKIYDFKEIAQVCKQYKLQFRSSKEYIGEIPIENAEEISEFIQDITKKKHHRGFSENNGYYIDLEDLHVVAPESEFRKEKPIDYDDDPVVLAPVKRFLPTKKANVSTQMYVYVTSWGLEKLLLENNSNGN